MKQIIPVLLFAIFPTISFSQPPAPTLQWEKSYGGSASEDAYCIGKTSDSGFIMVGPSQSTDGQVTGHHGTSSNYDYWVVKLNDTGAIQWENSFGGSADEIANSVQQTLDGGYIVGGASESVDGDLSTCDTFEYAYWLLKLSPTGSVVWKNCYGSPGGAGFNKANSVAQNADSTYVAAGFTNSSDTEEVSGYHGGAGDFWVIKVSKTGGFVWGKCLGGSSNDVANCVQPTADGGYIVAGYTSSTDGQVTGNHGSTDYWVVKLDDTGGLQWEKCYGGTNIDKATYVRQTYDGGFIVAGESYSINGQVTGHHGDTLTSDFWILKLDVAGGLQWQTSLGGTQNDAASSIQQTSDSGYIIAGNSNSTDGNVTGNHGNDDFWVAKISKNGYFQWQGSLGGSGPDNGYSVQQTADSGYVVAGGSSSTDGQVTGNHGNDDFWLVKLSACKLAVTPTITRTGFALGTSLPYTSYRWELNGAAIPGATTSTYTFSTNGNYTVFVSDTNACTGSATTYSVVGIKPVYNNQAISVMPNPTTGIIRIGGAGMVNIEIYNLSGQLEKVATGTDNISISDLPAAVYFIRLKDADGVLIYEDKILKK